MFCEKCGSKLSDDSRFCENCGAMVSVPKVYQQPMEKTIRVSPPRVVEAPKRSKEEPVKEKKVKEPKEPNNKRVRNIIIGVVVFLLLAALAGVAAFIFLGKDDKKTEVNTESETVLVDPETEKIEDSLQEEADLLKEPEAEPEPEPEIPYDVTEGGIHRYTFVVDDCSWTEAAQKARERGGYLARINSEEEFQYLLGRISELDLGKIQFRVGGRRNLGSTEYYWVDENDQTYGNMLNAPDYWLSTHWMANEPSFQDGETEECYLEFFYSSKYESWLWNDVPDDVVSIVPSYSGYLGFIIEYED